jgi:hypothetical protein
MTGQRTEKQKTEDIRWQSARDAWAWAAQIEQTRDVLRDVDAGYRIHTMAPTELLTRAAEILRYRAKVEVKSDITSMWIVIGLVNVIVPFLRHWMSGTPITVAQLTFDVVLGVLFCSLIYGSLLLWMARLRRRALGYGRTTPAPSDSAVKTDLPDLTDSHAILVHAAWRAGLLAQSVRLLWLPSRLAAARKAKLFEEDVTAASMCLYGAMELLKSLGEYAESARRGEQGGQLR